MGKFVHLLVCLTALFSTGYALKCYKCSSDTVDDCKKKLTAEHETMCNNPAHGQIAFCYYRVDQDKKNKYKENITASCEFAEKQVPLDKDHLQQCADPSRNYAVKECFACTKDFCNSAPVFGETLVVYLFSPFIYIVIRLVLQ